MGPLAPGHEGGRQGKRGQEGNPGLEASRQQGPRSMPNLPLFVSRPRHLTPLCAISPLAHCCVIRSAPVSVRMSDGLVEGDTAKEKETCEP
jgi:hypothetical protein